MSSSYALDLLWEWRATLEKGLSPNASIEATLARLEHRTVGMLLMKIAAVYDVMPGAPAMKACAAEAARPQVISIGCISLVLLIAYAGE